MSKPIEVHWLLELFQTGEGERGGVEKGYIPKSTYLDATERSNTHVEEHSIQDWHRNEL